MNTSNPGEKQQATYEEEKDPRIDCKAGGQGGVLLFAQQYTLIAVLLFRYIVSIVLTNRLSSILR